MPYEQIEHTADVGLHVWADDLDGLFRDAAAGLIAVMGATTGPPERSEHVVIDAPDAGALLVDWLSELLWLFEGRSLAPVGYVVHVEGSDGTWRLRAEVTGADASTFEQHGPAVKAVTYHALRVAPAGKGWDATVYLDI